MLCCQHKSFIPLLLIIFVSIVGVVVLQEKDVESEVHLAILKDLGAKLKIESFSFYSHPSTCRGVKLSSHPTIAKVLFDDFYQRNNVISSKPRQLLFPDNQYHVINKEDSRLIYSGKSPKLNNIPKQLINLSRAGFNASKTQALVCVESEESGDLVYLSKDGEKWVTKKWSYIW